jgi:Lon protease-like protein
VTAVFVPIFPLPDVVFFPNTLLPLHIFEARYRAMVTDCLARDKRLAVVGLRAGYEATYHGRPPVFAVAGLGEIVQWARLATGRFDIVLRGDGRVHIDREVPADTLYRIAMATRLEDRGVEHPEIESLAAGLRERCRRLLAAIGRPASDMAHALDASTAAGVLGDQVAAALLPDVAERQALLEELEVGNRLAHLSRRLDDLLRDVGEAR